MNRVLRTVPLPWRLAAAAAGCVAVLALALTPFEVRRVRSEATQRVDEQIAEELAEMEEIMLATGRPDLVLGSHGNEPLVAVLPAGEVGSPVGGAWVFANGAPLQPSDEVRAAVFVADGSEWRVLAEVITIDATEVMVVSAVPEEEIDRAVRGVYWRMLGGGLLVVVLVGAGTLVAALLSLRAVERIRLSAARVARGEPGATVEVPRADDELRRLGEDLDRMLGELRQAVELRDRFLAEASHELRTPVARLRTEVEVALHRPRTVADLTASLEGVGRHARQLDQLVNELLDLARLDLLDGPAAKRLDLRELMEDVAHLRPEVQVQAAAGDFEGDPQLLRRVLLNLVENAMVHGEPPVVLTASLEADSVRFRVTNLRRCVESGDVREGVPLRRRGTGLGLRIVQRIVDLHRGTFNLSDEADLTIAEVVVPLPVESSPPSAWQSVPVL